MEITIDISCWEELSFINLTAWMDEDTSVCLITYEGRTCICVYDGFTLDKQYTYVCPISTDVEEVLAYFNE